jgi:hypothetical protein
VCRGQAISDFEFNSVIISILIAFALSEILSSWSRLIKNRERVATPWLYVAVSGWLFSSLILHWLGLSAYRGLDFGRTLQSLLVFSPSIVGAAAAFVLTPELPAEGNIEIDKHYFSIAPFAFPLIAAYLVLSGLSDLLVPGEEPTPLFVPLAFGALLFSLGLTRRRAMHRGVLALALTWTAVGFLFGQV